MVKFNQQIRFQNMTFIVMLILCSCQTLPIYQPGFEPPPALRIQTGSRVAIFSVLERSVAVSNSQGNNWIARRNSKDYLKLYTTLSKLFRTTLHLEIIPTEEIRNLALYQDGFFPLKEIFYNNTLELPIVASEKEVELMLRTRNRLRADYYITALMEHSVSKIMLHPLKTSSTLYLTLYDARTGPIFNIRLEASHTALPYDRDLSLTELLHGYAPIINSTIDKNVAEIMQKARIQLSQQISLRPIKGHAAIKKDAGL